MLMSNERSHNRRRPYDGILTILATGSSPKGKTRDTCTLGPHAHDRIYRV
jgi:hypothetical protein